MCSGPPNFASALKLAEAPGAKTFLQTDSTTQAQKGLKDQQACKVSRSTSAIRAMQPDAQTMSSGDAANGILQAKVFGSGTVDVLASAVPFTRRQPGS